MAQIGLQILMVVERAFKCITLLSVWADDGRYVIVADDTRMPLY